MFEYIPAPGIIGALDIIIVAFVLYWVMLLLKGTRAERMLWGLIIVVIVYFVSERMELFTLHWILSNFLGSLIVIIIVVFQQDIRRALVQMGRPFAGKRVVMTEFLEEISKAILSMSTARMGGLIAIERSIDLDDYLDTGVTIDAVVSRELILSVFNTDSPMHDGAVTVRHGRVAKAGCILPLTRKELTKSLGTRHRAAVGLSEETDAVVVVVSEKSGDISIVSDERLELALKPVELLPRLRKLLEIRVSEKKKGFFTRSNRL